MSKLKELEKRLRQEPNNLGLRVTIAGALREAGRSAEAVELYRSVALAYRDQGRPQQAIAVCRSILEIAPDDLACQGLLATMVPARAHRSSIEETPLPRPMPYHLADPTSQRVSKTDLDSEELPAAPGAKVRPGADTRPPLTGLAQAARRISGLIMELSDEVEIDVSEELETRKVQKLDADQLRKIGPPPTLDPDAVHEHDPDGDVTDRQESITPIPPGDTEEEQTSPRDMPHGTAPRRR